MIPILLLSLARAEDLTWTCPSLATPADGAVFRDTEATGVRDFSDAVEAIARGHFDASCPDGDLGGTTACYTDSGNAIAAASTDKGVDVVVVPASGELGRLTASWDFGVPYSEYGYILHDDVTLSVSWEGVADTAWTSDASVQAEALSQIGYFEDGEYLEANWDDGTCAWSVTMTIDAASLDTTTWHIEADGHELDVTEGPADTCMPLGAKATLDGMLVQVYPETWTTADGDADGDGLSVELGDCDDTDPTIYPCAFTAVCDAIDHDCDGVAAVDGDGDGYLSCEDCDDLDPAANPVGYDPDCDGTDQDCNGLDGPDADGDGYSICDDCDDADDTINPGSIDTACDGIDKNCDTLDSRDRDADGFSDCDDCDDGDPDVHPGATEISGDGIDQDCDGTDTPSPSAPQAGEPRDKPESTGCATVPGPTALAGLVALLLATRRYRRLECSG